MNIIREERGLLPEVGRKGGQWGKEHFREEELNRERSNLSIIAMDYYFLWSNFIIV